MLNRITAYQTNITTANLNLTGPCSPCLSFYDVFPHKFKLFSPLKNLYKGPTVMTVCNKKEYIQHKFVPVHAIKSHGDAKAQLYPRLLLTIIVLYWGRVPAANAPRCTAAEGLLYKPWSLVVPTCTTRYLHQKP